MKKKLTSAKTRRDPDSRINKALRRRLELLMKRYKSSKKSKRILLATQNVAGIKLKRFARGI